MDYTSSSSTPYKGMVTRWEGGAHHDEEWMMSSAPPSTAATKIEVVEEGGSASSSSPSWWSSIEREHMFDKVVTPSDVGKLNRLVIPKQHAEKYFPLDSRNNEKGLLLNFEDRSGKPWRFRYSYWNSSQSYVMTKGWSRFVKEKKLDAGDIVSFQRGLADFKHRFFIDWRRRPNPNTVIPAVPPGWSSSSPTFVLRSHPHLPPPPPPPYSYGGGGGVWDHHHHLQQQQQQSFRRGGNYGFGYGNVVNPYPMTGSLIFLRSSSSSAGAVSTMMNEEKEEGNGETGSGMVYESVPVVQGKGAAKRLRLFGVNMDCPISSFSHQTHDFDILSSSLATSSTPNHHPHPHLHLPSSVGPPLPLSPSSFNGNASISPNQKPGKSSTPSSMSLDFDI